MIRHRPTWHDTVQTIARQRIKKKKAYRNNVNDMTTTTKRWRRIHFKTSRGMPKPYRCGSIHSKYFVVFGNQNLTDDERVSDEPISNVPARGGGPRKGSVTTRQRETRDTRSSFWSPVTNHTHNYVCVYSWQKRGCAPSNWLEKKKPEFQRASRHFRSLTRSSPLQPINGADYLVSLELHFDCKGSRIHKTVKNCTPTEENR